jgi:hypothetical protein
MTLIEKICIAETQIMFYDGIDFDLAMSHSDRSVFIIFLVESYVESAKSWMRNRRIESVLEGKSSVGSDDIPEIDNANIAIYQTSGNTMAVYETVKKKLLSEPQPWSPPWGIA